MSPEEWQAELRYLRGRATLDWCSDALALIPWWRWFPRLLVRLIMRNLYRDAGCEVPRFPFQIVGLPTQAEYEQAHIRH